MELYLFIALFLIYVLSSLLVHKTIVHKIFLAAFLLSSAITAVSVSFLRLGNQEVMMNAGELSWYYILYLFSSLMVVLGIINLLMFRHQIIGIFWAKDQNNINEEKK